MKISKAAAVSLFAALSVPTAKNWGAKRLVTKLAQIKDLIDDDTSLEGDNDTNLQAVLAAIENEEAVEIEGAAPATGTATTGKTDAEKATAKAEKDAAKKLKDEEKAKAKTEKDAAAAKVKADKEKAKADAPKGVRNSRTRPYLAGIIINKAKHKTGVTDAMVTELDEMFGKANAAESMFCLRNAWHAIRGFEDGEDKTPKKD